MLLNGCPFFLDLEPDSVQLSSKDPLPSIVQIGCFAPFHPQKKVFNVFCQSLNYPERQRNKYPGEKFYSFQEGWNQFVSWMGDKKVIILSYNLNPPIEDVKPGEDQLPGDWNKIVALCNHHKIPVPDVFLFDVLKLVNTLNLRRKTNLQAMREYFGLPYEGAHRADIDAKTLFKVFLKICGSAPLEQVYQAMAKPGDNTQAIATLIKSYQVVKPIFIHFTEDLKELQAYAPYHKPQLLFHKKTPDFKEMIREFKAFLRSHNPLSKIVMISTLFYGNKQPLLDSRLDEVGKKSHEWKYFDLGWLYTTLYKKNFSTEEEFFQDFDMEDDLKLTFAEKLEKCFRKMIGDIDPLCLYQTMLEPSHPIKAVAAKIRNCSSVKFKPLKKPFIAQPLQNSNIQAPLFFIHLNKQTLQLKPKIQAYLPKTAQSKDLNSFKELGDLLDQNEEPVRIVAFDFFKDQRIFENNLSSTVLSKCIFFDLSYFANALFGYLFTPQVPTHEEKLRLAEAKKKQKSDFNKYLEYYIAKRPVTLQDLYAHYHLEEASPNGNEAEKLSRLFHKMTDVLSSQQIQEGLSSAHPFKTLASLVKTHRKSVSIFWDTETTGLFTKDLKQIEQLRQGNDCTPRIVEIGACKLHENGKKEYFETLIDPQISIPADATKIHHIADAMVKGKPLFTTVWKDFLHWVRKDVPDSAEIRFIGHNQEGYDRVLAYLSCRFHKLPTAFPINATFFDTVIFSRSLHAKTEEDASNEEPAFKNSLENIANVYGIVNEDPHRAIGDVKTTMTFFDVATKEVPKDVLKRILDGKKSEYELAQIIRSRILSTSKSEKKNETTLKRKRSEEESPKYLRKKAKISSLTSPRRVMTRSQTRKRVILD